MDAITVALLESWDRQADIIRRLAAVIDESVLEAKPSEDGWPIAVHLCHVHEVRFEWLTRLSAEHAKDLAHLFTVSDDKWIASRDLALIRAELDKSAEAVGKAVRDLLESGSFDTSCYSHPVMFLQHMVWHEGWHYGLIGLALRLSGRELSDAWEEENVWGIWRTE